MNRRTLLIIFALVVLPTTGFATYLDLTTTLNDSGTFGPTTFRGDFTQPVGTGVFDPFWRAQQQGNATTYEFFNTDARPLSGDLAPGNKASGGDITNRTFLVSTLSAVNGDYVFTLDTNQENSAKGALLSMDKFVIRTSSSNTLSTFATLASANLIYDIDGLGNTCLATGGSASCTANASNGVILTEALNPGSGKTNMVALVPTSLFAGHTNEYFYLDVQFGQLACCNANDGFEEWSALQTTNFVPEPTPYVFLTLAIGALVIWNTKKRRGTAS